MNSRIEQYELRIDPGLHRFLVDEVLPGCGINPDAFFAGFSAIVRDLAPKNRDLLDKRDRMQAEVDAWYRENGAPVDLDAYETFLRQIGYLLPEGADFSVSTANVDPEIATIAGPQLVVPVMNARYALNAANARWGSLYDALYGTDAMGLSQTFGLNRMLTIGMEFAAPKVAERAHDSECYCREAEAPIKG